MKRLVAASLLTAAPTAAILPLAFALWLHHDTQRFIDVIRSGGVCGEIGSGPVQIRIIGALVLLAVVSVVGAVAAWRSLRSRLAWTALAIGVTVAVAVLAVSVFSLDAGTAVLGCASALSGVR